MIDDEDDFNEGTRHQRSNREDEDYEMRGRRQRNHNARRVRRRRIRGDDEERGRRRGPAYPRQLTIASWVWIKVGILILISGAVMLTDVGRVNKQGFIFDGPVALILIMLFGAVFIHVGVHTLHGTAKDTIGNGIGSLIFGLLEGANGVNYINGGETLAGLISLMGCIGLLVAGVFALHTRADYLEWLARGKRARVR